MSYKKLKVAFVFPGQGAQYVGMAKDFIESNKNLNNTIENFDKNHNSNLKSIMLNGPEESLKETRFTQPAILFHSIAAMKSLLEKLDIKPDFVAGHSLGEFSALVANGTLSLEDAMHLVHKRGEFMIRASKGTTYAMSAIIGPNGDKVADFCKQAESEGIVVAANFNTPVQTVISGEKAAVEKAGEIAKENGAKRVVPLVVGGAFHSPLIQKASEWLSEEMDKVEFNTPSVPVISNVDADKTQDTEKIKDNLAKQVTSPVRWVECINKIIEEGVDFFIEFGPQKVLAGMMRKIDRKQKIFNIDKIEDIEKVIKGIEDYENA